MSCLQEENNWPRNNYNGQKTYIVFECIFHGGDGEDKGQGEDLCDGRERRFSADKDSGAQEVDIVEALELRVVGI